MRRTAIVLVLALLLLPLSATVGEAATFDWRMVWERATEASGVSEMTLAGIGYGGPIGYVAVGQADDEPLILTSPTAAPGSWTQAAIY